MGIESSAGVNHRALEQGEAGIQCPPRIQYGSEREKCKGVILKRVHPRSSLAYVASRTLSPDGLYRRGVMGWWKGNVIDFVRPHSGRSTAKNPAPEKSSEREMATMRRLHHLRLPRLYVLRQ